MAVWAAVRSVCPLTPLSCPSATDEEAPSAPDGGVGGSQICVDGCRYIPVAEAASLIVTEARKLVEVR